MSVPVQFEEGACSACGGAARRLPDGTWFHSIGTPTCPERQRASSTATFVPRTS